MLSLALLPIGLIAVSQTKQVSDAQRENSELVLLTRTEAASFKERFVIEQARGAARLLGALQERLSDVSKCEEYLRAFVATNPRFSFIGVLPASGVMECSSQGDRIDFSQLPAVATDLNAEEPFVTVNQEPAMGGSSVIVVSEPYFDDNVFLGTIKVSVPHSKLEHDDDDQSFFGLKNVITFNSDGDILTAQGTLDDALTDTPKATELGALRGKFPFSFSGYDQQGRERIYAVVPIIDDAVYTLGVWDRNSYVAKRMLGQIPPWIFPALMWAVSLIVALFAVHRLVIRHVRKLGQSMNDFARDRRLPKTELSMSPPAELGDMETDFYAMADTIIRDEAQQENNLRDKSVLIKEVHHRVKNNLQLISSIMNMQRRRATSPETKEVIARLQDRVTSLATIHRDLYQSQTGGRVNAGDLVKEIVEKSVEISQDARHKIKRTIDVDPILLYPDQAVPLSLLIAEASTNAMKYIGPDSKGEQWVKVSLKTDENLRCSIIFENSASHEDNPESTGLGAQLIGAFTMQLGGELHTDETGDSYRMDLTFQIQEFIEESADF